MNIYAIYACVTDEEPIVRTLADGPEEALENVKCVPGVECYMTSTAYAVEVREP